MRLIKDEKKLFTKKIQFLAAASALIFILNGCYSYKPVSPAINSDTFTDINKKEMVSIPQNCKLLSLEKAVEIALKNNPDFISTKHSMAAAWSRYHQSLAAYFPTISTSYDLGGSYSKPSRMNGYRAGTRPNKTTGYDQKWGLDGQWLIFDGLMRTMNMLEAKHTAKEFDFLVDDAQRILVESITTAYNNILLAKENMRIAEADMKFNKELLQETKDKYNAGAVSLSDVLNFEIRYNNAKNSLIIASYSFKTSKYVLAELMGLSSGRIPDKIKFPKLTEKKQEKLAGIKVYLDTALKNRPDLSSMREAVEAAQYDVYSKWGAFSPVVTGNASWGLSYGKTNTYRRLADRNAVNPSYSRKETTSGMSNDLDYGGLVSWELFSGGSRWTRLRESQALLAQTEYSLEQKWIEVVAEVRESYENYKQNTEQLKLFKTILKLVKKNRDLVEEEYKAGSKPLTRLNEAQTELVQADSNSVQALINLLNAKAQLDAAIGKKILPLFDENNNVKINQEE